MTVLANRYGRDAAPALTFLLACARLANASFEPFFPPLAPALDFTLPFSRHRGSFCSPAVLRLVAGAPPECNARPFHGDRPCLSYERRPISASGCACGAAGGQARSDPEALAPLSSAGSGIMG